MSLRLGIGLFILFFTFIGSAQTFIDHMEKGNELVKKDKLADAIVEYKKVIELHPANGIARLQLGLIYANIGDYKQSLRYSNEAIRINPNSHRAHLNTALVYMQQGNLNKAFYHLKRVLSLEPKSIKAHYSLATIYNDRNDYSNAIKEYKECIKISSQYAKAHVGMAGVYYRMGQKAMALKQVKALKDINEVDLANGLSRWIDLQESKIR
jgi:Tfp pilus assembly protein PilF